MQALDIQGVHAFTTCLNLEAEGLTVAWRSTVRDDEHLTCVIGQGQVGHEWDQAMSKWDQAVSGIRP